MALARAVGRIEPGETPLPFRPSGIPEVARLANASNEAYGRLAVRTAERERLLQEVDAQRELLRTAIENSPTGMALLRGPQFVFELVNPAYQAIGPGMQPLGRAVAEVWPELAPRVLPLLEEVRRTGQPYRAIDVQAGIQR